jgi:hypothetical protein
MSVRGGCLCQAVRWRVDEVSPLAHCHCSVCRKAHGTAFATFMAAPLVEFEAGESALTIFESSPGFKRAFCSHCGSMVPGVAPDGHCFVPAGGFIDDPGVTAKIHLFVPSKAPWHEITDGLRQFDAFPDRDGPASLRDRVPRGPRNVEARGADEALRGSCNCGAVVFEVDPPTFTRAHNCHCTRCRRAHAAAYASNGVVPNSALRYLRGSDHLARYALEGADRFAQVFCKTCGSAMPRRVAFRNVAVIPLGSLDGSPHVELSRHIFVANKAPWHEITDDLPTHAAAQ